MGEGREAKEEKENEDKRAIHRVGLVGDVEKKQGKGNTRGRVSCRIGEKVVVIDEGGKSCAQSGTARLTPKTRVCWDYSYVAKQGGWKWGGGRYANSGTFEPRLALGKKKGGWTIKIKG